MPSDRFTVTIPEPELADLRQRLQRHAVARARDCCGLGQGLPLAYARELADYWAGDYDWRRCEGATQHPGHNTSRPSTASTSTSFTAPARSRAPCPWCSPTAGPARYLSFAG